MKNVFIIFLFFSVFDGSSTSRKVHTTTNTAKSLYKSLWSYCSYQNSFPYPRHIIKLRQLFEEQKAASNLYHDLCGLEYLQLNKMASFTNDTKVVNRGVALLLGSIFSITPAPYLTDELDTVETERKINFDLPGQVAYHLPEEDSEEVVTFKVVIRFDQSSMSLFQNFTAKIPLLFANEHFELQLMPFKNEYLLPTTFKFNKTMTAQARNNSRKIVYSNSSNQTAIADTGVHFPEEILPYIYSSYYLVCTNVFRYEFACMIDVKEYQNHSVLCYCPHNRLGTVFVIVFFLLSWPLLLFFSGCCSASSLSGQKPRAEESCDGFNKGNAAGVTCPGDVQVNNVLCSASEATEQYLITFRLGPSTDGFQATAYTSTGNRCGPGWVDIQLLVGGGGDGSHLSDGRIGSPMRFPLAPKIDAARVVLSELVMLVLKRGKMQPISALQLCHSSPGQLLLLYDFTVVDLTVKATAAVVATAAADADVNASKPAAAATAEVDAVLQRVSLNCFITGQPNTVRVVERSKKKVKEEEDKSPAHKTEAIPKLKRSQMASAKAEANDNSDDDPFDWMSVELRTLDSAERLSFSVLALGSVSLLVMAVMNAQLSFQAQDFFFRHRFLNWLDLAESWPGLLLFLLLSSLVGWLLLGLLQLIFTLAIKQFYVLEQVGLLCRSALQPETSFFVRFGGTFTLFRLAWVALFFTIGLAAFAYAICLSRKLDYALAGVWSAATTIILVLSLGAWRLTGDGLFAWARAVRAQATYFSVLQADGRTYAAVRVDDKCRGGRRGDSAGSAGHQSGSTIAALRNEPKSADSSRREHVRESIGPKLVNPRLHLRWLKQQQQQQQQEEKSLEKKGHKAKRKKKKPTATTQVKRKVGRNLKMIQSANGNSRNKSKYSFLSAKKW